MTIEDFVLKFEGLDPVKIKDILNDASNLLNVIEATLPQFRRLIGDVKTEIAAYEAKQKELGS